MKIVDLWKSNTKPTISFELFPGRSEKGVEKLEKVIDKLVAVEPDFVSVTFGAGGGTREGSYQLVKKLKEEKGVSVLPYFASFGLGPENIISIIGDYRDLGIESVLCIRGDSPKVEGFEPHPQSPAHATDLLTLVGDKFDDLCLGAAGYPEGHPEAKSLEKDVEYVKLKVDKGAQFIIANYFWDNRYFFEFMELCNKAGIDVPIIPGIMPVYNVKMMENLASMCGATITDELLVRIDALPKDDKKALNDFGVNFATAQCADLIKSGVPGLHIYTMDRAKSAVAIVRRLRNEQLI